MMRQLGLKPSDTELEDLMNEIDTDRSGTISFEGKRQVSPSNTLSNVDYASCFLRCHLLKFISHDVVPSPGMTIIIPPVFLC